MTLIPTDRLRLSAFKDGFHLKVIAKWLNDPDVVRYSEQRHRRHDEESQAHYIAEKDIFREINVRDYPDGEGNIFIGTITASIDRPNSVADVGILIGEKSQWGKGYGTEAWTAFCEHLLSHGIRKIEAGCMSANFGMLHIFRKYGMFHEGHRTHHFLHGDQLYDMEYWGKF